MLNNLKKNSIFFINKNLINIFLSLILLVLSLLFFFYGFPHEDAYILFNYSQNFSKYNSIIYDLSSGRAEGATDFLWMIILGLLKKANIPIYFSSLLINTISFFLIIKYFKKLIPNINAGLYFIFTLILFFSGGVTSSLVGFSTLFFTFLLIASLYYLINFNFLLFSLFSIIFCLTRPEGITFVFSFFLISNIVNFKDKIIQKKINSSFILIFIICSIYMIFRLVYFKEFLPLPLQVKSVTDTLFEGLIENINIFKYYIPIYLALFFFRDKKFIFNIKNLYFLSFLPFFLLLSVVHQSQNIGGRFQFPFIVMILIFFFLNLKNDLNFKKYFIIFLMSLYPIFFGFKNIYIITKETFFSNIYINSFPQNLVLNNFKISNIAISEAGKFVFWTKPKKAIDLVGLNSKNIINNGPYKILNDQKPDLIFFHHINIIKLSNKVSRNQDYIEINDFNLFETKDNYNNYKLPVKIAAAMSVKFIKENSDLYRAYFVKYGPNDKNFFHVYFIKKRLDRKKFEKILKESFKKKMSYFDSIKKIN